MQLGPPRVEPPPWAEPVRHLPRGVLLALPLVLMVVAAAWLLLGLRPSLAEGSLSVRGGFRVAGDGVEDTRWVAPPRGAEGWVTVTNRGRLPVTLGLGLEHPLFAVLGYRPVTVDGLRVDGDGPLRDHATLAPGQQTAVRVRAAIPACTAFAAGSSSTVTALPVHVRSLGLLSTHDLPLPLPITVVGPNPRVPGCP